MGVESTLKQVSNTLGITWSKKIYATKNIFFTMSIVNTWGSSEFCPLTRKRPRQKFKIFFLIISLMDIRAFLESRPLTESRGESGTPWKEVWNTFGITWNKKIYAPDNISFTISTVNTWGSSRSCPSMWKAPWKKSQTQLVPMKPNILCHKKVFKQRFHNITTSFNPPPHVIIPHKWWRCRIF